MSNFNLPSSSPFPHLLVQLPYDLSHSALLNFKPFTSWLDTLSTTLSQQSSPSHPFHSSPYLLHSIHIQCVDYFGGGRIGFLKLKASISNSKGESLPGSVFMRGGSVGMLLILSPDDAKAESGGDEYAVLTLQPRIPAGSLAFLEIPAGMIDDAGTFGGAAAKEIKEETGLDIKEDELIDMTKLAHEGLPADERGEGQLEAAMYTTPGGSDEFMPLFLARKTMESEEIEEMKGKLTGLRDHGEKITLKIVKLADLWKYGARDGKTLAAVALYEGLRREGKV
jgi:ADP-sugar diphosphatase